MTSWLDLATIEEQVTELRPDYTALLIVAEGLQPGGTPIRPSGQAEADQA